MADRQAGKYDNDRFRGIWIDSPLVRDKDIKGNVKILYALILELYKANGSVYASNGYLADVLNIENSVLRRSVAQLEEKGFIKRNIVFDSPTNVERRYIIPLKYV